MPQQVVMPPPDAAAQALPASWRAAPSSGPASTGPASTDPASTDPASTGPAGTDPVRGRAGWRLPAPTRGGTEASGLRSAVLVTLQLFDLPGIVAVCVLDVATGARVVERWRAPSAGSGASARGTRMMAVLPEPVDHSHEVVITTREQRHVITLVPDWGARGGWIYLIVDRGHTPLAPNLAALRTAISAAVEAATPRPGRGAHWRRSAAAPTVVAAAPSVAPSVAVAAASALRPPVRHGQPRPRHLAAVGEQARARASG